MKTQNDNVMKNNIIAPQSSNLKSRMLIVCLLLCSVFTIPSSGKANGKTAEFNQAQAEFDNGNYLKAMDLAKIGLEKVRKGNEVVLLTEGLDIVASAEISLEKYKEAEDTLNEALKSLPSNESNNYQKAKIYLKFAWLYRSQRKFTEALAYSKKARETAPENREIEAEHYLNIGRILFTSGYDVSAIIWLEKAEKMLITENTNTAKLDTFRFLTLAWWSKLNYQTALKYTEKSVLSAENTQFKYKYRQGLFDRAIVLSSSGQEKKAISILENGLKHSIEHKDFYQGGKFLTSLLLHALNDGDTNKAALYLTQLEQINSDRKFDFEIKLGRAIICAFQGQKEDSETLFSELNKMKNTSKFILPRWKMVIAERNKDWKRMIELNREYLDLIIGSNFKDELPAIHLDFAKAYFNLNKMQPALEHLEKSLAFVEEIRQTENNNLSLTLFETYHDAYRLLTQIKFDNPQESFELADFLKARVLKDKINNSVLKADSTIPIDVRQKLEELSVKFIEDQNVSSEIEKYEKLITTQIPELNLSRPDLSRLDKISSLNDAAVISYFITLDKKLIAFVWEKGKSLQKVDLPISEDEIETIAKSTQQNIKNRIFFKRDGKAIYDKLLKPLNLTAKHLIFVPDKSLWKIPFQALSSDGEKYLIEEKLISYTPSVSILLEQLKNSKSARQNLQVFANSSYANKDLEYVNNEATKVAGIYNSKPKLNATVSDFLQNAANPDILHFSMHAQVDSEQPLDSFLGFRKIGKDDGRLTVEKILNSKLKKGSLVFLASCDTNNVLNGEGLVSLAWGMMASGATSVISAQWEANDKSTAVFTKSFYENYKQGSSTAEAMQKAAVALIGDKSNKMHEPYFWADFTLNGDFR